jgi:hypothetical protein
LLRLGHTLLLGSTLPVGRMLRPGHILRLGRMLRLGHILVPLATFGPLENVRLEIRRGRTIPMMRILDFMAVQKRKQQDVDQDKERPGKERLDKARLDQARQNKEECQEQQQREALIQMPFWIQDTRR